MLNNEQIGFVYRCLTEWNNVARDAGYSTGIDSVLANIDHSALLHRLLEGKEIYPSPPPRAFSYPWYALLEGKAGDHNEVHFHPNHDGREVVVINQAVWEFVRYEDEDLIARWPATGLMVRCRKSSNEHVPFNWTVTIE